MRINDNATLKACAATVAMAAPLAPILKPSMRVISPTMLITDAIDTKISGERESPSPLKTALKRL